jgi:hypothetical protein
MRGFDGQVRGFPCGETTGDFAHVAESVPLKKAGGDRRVYLAAAVDQQRTISRQFACALDEVIERQADAAGDEL